MKLIDKIMDTLSLYDEEDDLLDEELEVKKPMAKEEAPAKPERASLFRKKEITPTVKKEAIAAPVKQEKAAPVATEKKSFLSFKSSKSEPKKEDSGKMNSRTINLPVANKLINVIVLEPVSFDDSPKIADYLRNR